MKSKRSSSAAVRSRQTAPIVQPLEARRLLASISWAQPVNGSFDDPTKWTSGTVPGPGDDVTMNSNGNYKVAATADISVNSLTLGSGGNGAVSLEVDGASMAAQTVVVNRASILTLRNTTLTAPQGLTVEDQIELLDQSVIHANIDLGGILDVAGTGNRIDGVLTTHPGSNVTLSPVFAPADLTVSTGFVVNGAMNLNSTLGEIATLTIADGSAITIEGGPFDGDPQGILQGSGQIDGSLVNNGGVTPDIFGVPLTVNGHYTQSSVARLTAYVGRAADESFPSLLQVNGPATLAGMLEMDALGVIGKNKLPNGKSDTLMTYSSESGTFASTRGLNLRPSIGATSVIVTAGRRGTGNHLPPDLTVAVKANKSNKPIVPGGKASASVAVVNLGAGLASGSATLTLYASTDAQLDPADSILGSPLRIPVHLKPRGAKLFKISFVYPTLASGDYYLIANIAPALTIPDANASNNTMASEKTIHLS